MLPLLLVACLPSRIYRDASIELRGPALSLADVEAAVVVDIPGANTAEQVSCSEGFSGTAEEGRVRMTWTAMQAGLAVSSADVRFIGAGGSCTVTQPGTETIVRAEFRAVME